MDVYHLPRYPCNQPSTKLSALCRSARYVHSPLSGQAAFLHSHFKTSSSFWASADRSNVLEGHTGCVNALNWSANGEVLISAGDDTTVRLWRLDAADLNYAWPFTTQACIRTGHTENIFNAQLLSSDSAVLATCAGDCEVRVFDISRAAGRDFPSRAESYKGSWHHASESDVCLRVFNCHQGRVKRIAVEASDKHFLTVAEDGCVRQHDIRVPHRCYSPFQECPAPLIRVPHELSTLAMSGLTPYYFVVAGASPFAHLFDRRHCSRSLAHEWGVQLAKNSIATCVRKFGRIRRGQSERHAYSADAVYLFNTLDEPQERLLDTQQGLPPSATLNQWSDDPSSIREGIHRDQITSVSAENVQSSLAIAPPSTATTSVLPRLRYHGACNIDTVKDVNFLGHYDQFVTSGSDDGNFFIWSKGTGQLINILEGDTSVVNVIEQNPRYSCVAVSGIDHSVKIFGSRALAASVFSKITDKETIIESNTRRASLFQSHRGDIMNLVVRYRLTYGHDDAEGGETTCISQ